MSDFSFDFAELSKVNDPFAQHKQTFGSDSRFYTLTKDSEGNGQALLALLPDSECNTIIEVIKYNLSNVQNNERRYVSFFSPANVNLPDPFQQEWARLWNAGLKEQSRLFARTLRYLVNIKVVKDPANPSNEGKIFLYEMSSRLRDKVQAALCPSDADLAMGGKRKEVFNPFSHYLLRLVCVGKSATGFPSYDNSEFVQSDIDIYPNREAAVADIRENAHNLSWFNDPANYPSYDELLEKFRYFTFADGGNPDAQTVTSPQMQQMPQMPEVRPYTPYTPEVQDPNQATDVFVEQAIKSVLD